MLKQKLIIASILLLTGSGCQYWGQPSEAEINLLRTSIQSKELPAFLMDDELSREQWDWTRQVYTTREFQPVWLYGGKASTAADSALQTLENASAEGLDPQDFDLEELKAKRQQLENSRDANAQIDFELHLTRALVGYVSQLCYGRIRPKDVLANWPESNKTCDVQQLVSDALAQNTVDALPQQVAPKLPEYNALKEALRHYRDIAAKGGWKPVTLAKQAKTASPEERPVVAENLTLMGDLAGTPSQVVSDEALAEAVKRFESRHGLEADGIVDEKVAKAMSVPVEKRIEQIQVNLDRLRWTSEFEPRHVRVNIPGYHLSVHEENQIPLEMRVIVGSGDNKTPILDGQIEYLVFSPYWNIPLSIATEELLPQIKKDRNYLRKQNIEVVKGSGDKAQTIDPSRINWDAQSSEGLDYQLRQRPGTQNALGLVKFIFPNKYNVYLHDTPSDNLFDRLTRTLSHGCIRVEKPTELAAYVLRDQPEWTAEQIEEAMHAQKEKKVSLKTPLPVHLIYWTAWADSQGIPHFSDDAYGYDEKHQSTASARGLSRVPA